MNVLSTPKVSMTLSTPNANRVAEYGPDGKAIWEATVRLPGVPNWLGNGHVLVASHGNTRITELDRGGAFISDWHDPKIRPWFATKR